MKKRYARKLIHRRGRMYPKPKLVVRKSYGMHMAEKIIGIDIQTYLVQKLKEGYKLADFAEEFGLDQSTISRWIRKLVTIRK